MIHRRIIFLIAGFIAAALPAAAHAHEGHGATEGTSLWHYLTEPVHAAVIVAVVVIMIGGALWVARRRAAEREDRG